MTEPRRRSGSFVHVELMDSLLKLDNCTIRFGGLTAVANFNMEIRKRELVGLIGPNGAGKTTVFNMVTGVYRPTEGDVLLAGERLNGLKPYAITGKGIARTFQNIRLFSSLTVFDNVRAAFNLHLKTWTEPCLDQRKGVFERRERHREPDNGALKNF